MLARIWHMHSCRKEKLHCHVDKVSPMLPRDVFEELLFPYLTLGQLMALRQVSRDFKAAVDDSSLWGEMYCQQFNAPPVIPRSMAASAFVKRYNARLLRTAVPKPSRSDDIDYDVQVIEPDALKDWSQGSVSVASPRSINNSRCVELANPGGSIFEHKKATVSHRSHLFPRLRIRKLRILSSLCVVLTMEGEIWITYQKCTSLTGTYVLQPQQGSSFVDFQLEGDTKVENMIAVDDDGALYIWEPTHKGESWVWGDIIPEFQCTKFALCGPSEAVVYLQNNIMLVKGAHIPNILRVPSVKDFVCLKTRVGFRIVMLLQDGTMQECLLYPPSRETMSFTQTDPTPLAMVNKLIEPGDSLHSIAGYTNTASALLDKIGTVRTNSRVWLLTTKGRLIECSFGAHQVSANVYRGLEVIVSVSLGPRYRDHYVHHWDGSVYWLGDRYTSSAFKIDVDPCMFLYFQRVGSVMDTFVGVTALFI